MLAFRGNFIVPRKVLIVDDDTGLCRLIAQTLRRQGYECQVAFSGEEGLNMWRTGKPELILLDIAMPLLTGWDVTRAIRAEEKEGEHTPIVIMTAQARLFDLAQDMHDKIDGYLAKPLEAPQIISQVEKLIGVPDLPSDAAQ
jgi:two-component system, OmpR family, response regulator ResD